MQHSTEAAIRNREIDKELLRKRRLDEDAIKAVCIGDYESTDLFLKQIKILYSHKSILKNKQKLKNKLEYEYVTFMKQVITEKKEYLEGKVTEDEINELILWCEGDLFTSNIAEIIKKIIKIKTVQKYLTKLTENDETLSKLVLFLDSCDNVLVSDYLPNHDELFYLWKKYPKIIDNRREFRIQMDMGQLILTNTAGSLHFNHKLFSSYLTNDVYILCFIPLTDYNKYGEEYYNFNKFMEFVAEFFEFTTCSRNEEFRFLHKIIIFTNLREFESTLDDDFPNRFPNYGDSEISCEGVRKYLADKFTSVYSCHFLEDNNMENVRFCFENVRSNIIRSMLGRCYFSYY